ncbi:MAG: pseudouridine synthase [Terriglobales bacterium]
MGIRKFAPTPVKQKPARRDKPEMTLDRVLSRAGVASRTEAARLIAAGRVTVDGRTVRNAQQWVAPEREQICFDGQPLRAPRRLYWAFHKPAGVLTSHGDPDGRRTIYDVVGPLESWYFSVGRLDQDTTGLLLLTNDSIFAERIANPDHKVGKVYRVQVAPALQAKQLDRLRGGLDIGRGQRTAPARVEWLRENANGCWIEIEIHEGMNRQVRRMIEALGHRVLQLQRVRIGKLELGGLKAGRVRPVRPSEVV